MNILVKSKPYVIGFLILLLTIILYSCKPKTNTVAPEPPSSGTGTLSNTLGFGILNRIKGIWNGPVTSTTPLGSYPVWIVDFRPISANQIAAKNELDTANSIFMSLFIVKYANQYKVALRNGGEFESMTRVAYFLADSVSENGTNAFYRFAEIVQGIKRAYADFIFSGDSIHINTYTNQEGGVPSPVLHMSWNAGLQDTMSCKPAVANFSFPQKTLTKDFSSVSFPASPVTGLQESVYYGVPGTTPPGDPYPDNAQPYVGKTTANFSFALPTYAPNTATRVLLILTTQPLISGTSINMKNISRYVILNAGDNTYVFNSMHPGTYYFYAIYDANGDATYTNPSAFGSPGEWLGTSGSSFTLSPSGTATASVTINTTIP